VPALLLIAACTAAGDAGTAVTDSALATCSGADPAVEAAACSEPSRSIATAGPGAIPPPVEASRSYGLRLVTDAATGASAGAIRFVAPGDGDYLVYLGTPYMPMAISGGGASIEPGCSTRLLAADCSLMRRVLGVRLEAGVEYRFDFGPIAPQRWVRWRI
jgi:hypothetical protein